MRLAGKPFAGAADMLLVHRLIPTRIKQSILNRAIKILKAQPYEPRSDKEASASFSPKSGNRAHLLMSDFIWLTGHHYFRSGQPHQAVKLFKFLISHAELQDTQLLKILLLGQALENDELVEKALSVLTASRSTKSVFWRRPIVAFNKLPTMLNSILANLMALEDVDKLNRFVFGYLLKQTNACAIAPLKSRLSVLSLMYRKRQDYKRSITIEMRLMDCDDNAVSPTILKRSSDLFRSRNRSSDEHGLPYDARALQNISAYLAQLSKRPKTVDRQIFNQIVNIICEKNAEIRALPDPQYDSFVSKISISLHKLVQDEYSNCVQKITAAFGERAGDNLEFLLLRAHAEKWSYNYENAHELFERALANPNCNPAVQFELADILEALGNDSKALEATNAGLANFSKEELFLNHTRRLASAAGPLMRQGDLIAGWEQYQKRRDRFVLQAPSGTKIWQGESLGTERLLVLAEKGIGDEIRFASCYRDLKRRVKKINISSDPRLIPLLERSFRGIGFVPSRRDPVRDWKKKSLEDNGPKLSRALTLDLYRFATQFDELCMAGDLPMFFRRDRSAFPRHRGYLKPDPYKRKKWRKRLDGLGPGLKVGICWRSALQSYRRRQHYFTLEQLLPVLKMEGIHFANLQYDECEKELSWLEDQHGVAVHRWSDTDMKDDLDGIAALISELDLVIAPHIMVKELAGAVGTPTLFMVPTGQAWVRWRADPASMEDIWHPSVKHVYSGRAGDKKDVIAKTRSELEEVVKEHHKAKDWKPHRKGLHVVDCATAPVSAPDANPSDPAVTNNEFGESYLPAGVDQLPDRKARDLEWVKRQAKFRETAATLFNDAHQPDNPEGVLLYCGLASYKQNALTLLGAHSAMKRGWAVVSLCSDGFQPGPTKDPDVSYFSDIFSVHKTKRLLTHREYGEEELRFDWKIDWPERVCEAEGINFYGIIANRLGKEFRCYSVDTAEPKVAARLEILLKTCDAALAVCLDIEERLASRNIPVRITGFEPNYPPTGVFKVYCGARGYAKQIEFVEIRQAYEKYFRAGQPGLVSAIDVRNVTRNRLYSASGLQNEAFEIWFRENREDSEIVSRARSLVEQDRTGYGEPTAEGQTTLEKIRMHKSAGGKVACLYGCIPYDFGHPWLDKGPAHHDLRDWYNHTVTTLRDSDTLLLIKPHPSEGDFRQFGRPSEFFTEILTEPINQNTILLGHHWLNNKDLIPILDFGIVWRGSIATELILSGVPVLVCAPHSMGEQILDFSMPKDRADYEDLLHKPARITLSDEQMDRAMMAFEFYRSQIMITYPFGWIASKRRLHGPPVLSDAAIRTYLKNGHPSVDEICDRIIS